MRPILNFLACITLLSSCALAEVRFQSARPVWLAGRESEMNVRAGFRTVFEAPASGTAVLRVTASSAYRFWLNGQFAGYGPARAAHGYARVDEWPLAALLRPGRNLLAVEVAGYNVNTYYLPDQPAFLQAEIAAAGRVLAATGDVAAPFTALEVPGIVPKVARYSFQRPFSEVFRIDSRWDQWRSDVGFSPTPARVAVQPQRKLLPRSVPLPDFSMQSALSLLATGTLERREPAKLWKDRSFTNIGPEYKGFPDSTLETAPSLEIQRWATATRVPASDPVPLLLDPQRPLWLRAPNYALLDFGANRAGFLRFRVHCLHKARLYATFDEILSDGDVDFKRNATVNLVTVEMEPGDYDIECFEPYLMRYLRLAVLEGEAAVSHVEIRDYSNPDAWRADFRSSDPRLNRIFEAARTTYRQNSVDLFMDCPSRERAGWLGDGYFTARTALRLSGSTLVERIFLENFLLAPRNPDLPEGVFPMLYPGDHPNHHFIPTYNFWFVLQLEEYLARSGDRATVDAFRPRVEAMFRYFEPFRNSDGLLEKLESWVFIEWSAANRWVQDVNYPSNMMYAAALESAARLYGNRAWADQAGGVRETIRKQSFDGRYFADNAVRKDGRLEVTANHSEVCQYFAFYFGTATPQTHAALWQSLIQGPPKDLAPANVIFGKLLRGELLARAGLRRQLLDETIAGWSYMAERTGTLWENVDTSASTDHGLASHAAYVLYRDVLGVTLIDSRNKRVQVDLPDVQTDWCEGRLPVPDGEVLVEWRKQNGEIRYAITAPKGYKVELNNGSGLEASGSIGSSESAAGS